MSDNKKNSSTSRHTILIVLWIILASIVLCASGVVVKAVIDRSDYYEIIKRMDSALSEQTEVTRYYRETYWRHEDELYKIVVHMTPAEMTHLFSAIDHWMPNMRALLNGKGDTVVITAEQVEELTKILQLLASRGSPSLRDDINREMERLHPADFIGMTMTQAWVHLHEVWGIYDPTLASSFNYPYIIPTQKPWPTMTSSTTLHERTPQATLEGGEYAGFWAAYRDPDDGYGFTYPFDWVLLSQPDIAGARKWMMVCNYDSRDYQLEQTDRICVEMEEVPGIDPALPLDQAASKVWCESSEQNECGPISIAPETSGRPVHAKLHIKIIYWDPGFFITVDVFRNPIGKLISLYSNAQTMQTPEAQAIIDSFVFGNDTPIIAPAFEPSKKISIKGK